MMGVFRDKEYEKNHLLHCTSGKLYRDGSNAEESESVAGG